MTLSLKLKYNELELIKAKGNSKEALTDMLERIGSGGLTFIGNKRKLGDNSTGQTLFDLYDFSYYTFTEKHLESLEQGKEIKLKLGPATLDEVAELIKEGFDVSFNDIQTARANHAELFGQVEANKMYDDIMTERN